MLKPEQTIAFIGAGNMGEAMVAALIGAGLVVPSQVLVSDVRPERRTQLADTYGVRTTGDNIAAFAQADVVIVAVKPQQVDAVFADLAAHLPSARPRRRILVSIVAGIAVAQMEGWLYPAMTDPALLTIVRVMPNTPALVRCAMSVMAANRYASAQDVELVKAILGAMGEVIVMPEMHLDAVTALSGSGPAYVFYLAEAMIDAGIDLGLSRDDSYLLTLQTIKGAAALMAEQGVDPLVLRQRVTSPGGTTQAAVAVLDQRRVKENIVQAIGAAARRSRQLSTRG